jgi:2-amino-4-hydroxy-6-hydroxymethyldihydropteridine diphosphokinase
VFLGLGSNLGDRAAHLRAARDGIASLPGCRLLRAAGIFQTRPAGGPAGQEDYFNAGCLIETVLAPARLLVSIQGLEREIGRRRENEPVRWGPRIIDVDILLWDGLVLSTPDLVIPHPRLAERAFALLPLAELDPGAIHPGTGLTPGELLERIGSRHEVVRRLPF